MPSCPSCNASLRDGDGFPQWCAKCLWGVDASDAARAVQELALPGGKAHTRANARLLLRYGSSSPSAVGISVHTFAAAVLSVAIHIAGATLLALGIRRLLAGSYIDGGVLVVVTLGLCPWIRKDKLSKPLAGVADQSSVDEWVRDMAIRLGAPAPHQVIVAGKGFASTQRTRRGRRVVSIGPQTFALLSPRERDAMLAHELGHWTTGSLSRRLLTATAVNTLARMLAAVGLFPSESRRPLRHNAAVLSDGWTAGGFVMLRVLAMPLRPLTALMLSLLAEDRLAGGYCADRFAAQCVGTAPLDRGLRIVSGVDEVSASIRDQVAHRSNFVDWGVVRARLDAIPDDETTRRLLVDHVFELRRVRSHPPTIDRLQTL
jgi:heat shock protein HtpX